MASQRNSLAPKLLLGMALFETIAPLNGTTAGDACNGSEAQGFNLLLDPISGAMSTKPVTDVNGDGTVDVENEVVLLAGGDGLDGDGVVEELGGGEVGLAELLDERDTEIGVVARLDTVTDTGDYERG